MRVKISRNLIQFTLISVVSILFYSFAFQEKQESLKHPLEKHLKNIRQLTFGGENAEAYFSFDETKLIFQSTRDSFECDQIFIMNIDGSNLRLVSTGKGKTTCAYFLPGDTEIIYSSTHHISEKCPPKPDYSKGYVWALDNYDIFKAKADGSNLRQLTNTPGYDAEATVSPKGDKIVFTSMRDGDLEIYTMDLDGKNVKRLTFEKGYDGGAFFSWDGKKICYRAYHPKDSSEIAEYEQLLKEGYIKPMKLQIFVMDADGKNKRQITNNNAANFAPFFHPDGKRIIFSSNMHDPKGRDFDLYIVNIETGEIERITYTPDFDGFPMFTHDGKKLVWASNRNSKKRGETNIFIADWVD
ncbi:TolB family protein [Candidatus Chrysopegis kryptomonas]|uniref:WD40-like Beta Propeller Repeat n=1 Tax=Candidatus Chryseopegocella kryptomonas TaxID=1633643 RepID=A0A0P1NWL1_9BACT|nr:TolB family protein [Candidatus Chrysopegis kryptomonas]CUT03759.1 WD40-like Beta Propeller Repeat [Candidatus Chrysopegis kryptomonas]